MQQNNPAPGSTPPNDGKTDKQRKKEEAEKQKKLLQEKKRQLELNVQINSFNRTLLNSVIDVPTMFKLASNTIKSMLGVDHVAVSLFETYPEIRAEELCVCKSESALPKLPKPPAPKPKNKEEAKKLKELEAQKKKNEDLEPPKKLPVFPVPPKEKLKPGTLPRLENTIWDIPLLYKIKDIKQPAFIPDASKFPDPKLNTFTGMFGIKTILFLPVTVTLVEEKPVEDGDDGEVEKIESEKVIGVAAAMTVNEFKPLSQNEINSSQKAIKLLSKAVETAPPDLPKRVKKMITIVSKNPASDRLTDYYGSIFDDIFDLIVNEVGYDNCPESFIKVFEEKERLADSSKLKKMWFQVHQLVSNEGNIESIAKRSVMELFIQASEFSKAKKISIPPGFKSLVNYIRKNKKYEELKDIGIEEDNIDYIEEEIDKAIRGEALFTKKSKAVLINDVEQSNMLMNYVSAPSSIDFREHIKSAMEETDCPTEVDKELMINELSYFGMAEISKTVCLDIIERILYDLPEYLEQSQEKQIEQSEKLVEHFHRKIMINLLAALKGKKSAWVNLISKQIKEKAKEAAKKRVVMVGRMSGEEEEEDEED